MFEKLYNLQFFKNKKMSMVSAMHYCKLIFRSALFLLTAVIYILERFRGGRSIESIANDYPWAMWLVWAIFMGEMFLRLFPSKIESKGCQKQFKRNYIPTTAGKHRIDNGGVGTFASFSAWIMLNGAIYWLFSINFLDEVEMLLIALIYSICDMICILFFCPFQQWFLKNKCCGTCRIYNWDYMMMFTPLIAIRNFFCTTLVIAALVLLIVWELTHIIYPERFREETNGFLACADCSERLCVHKKALQKYLDTTRERVVAVEERVIGETREILDEAKDKIHLP